MENGPPLTILANVKVVLGVGSTTIHLRGDLRAWSVVPPSGSTWDMLTLDSNNHPVAGASGKKGSLNTTGMEVPCRGDHSVNILNADTDGDYTVLFRLFDKK